MKAAPLLASGLAGALAVMGLTASGDLTYHVSAPSGSIPANSSETAIADCGAGSRAISGGYTITDQAAPIRVVKSYAGNGADPQYWVVIFANDGSTANTNGGHAFAVCEEI